jgi:hypothetical protein
MRSAFAPDAGFRPKEQNVRFLHSSPSQVDICTSINLDPKMPGRAKGMTDLPSNRAFPS